MTYENDIEVEFDYDGKSYAATADVVVTMRKSDIGPIGYQDHVYSWVAEDLEIKNLKVGDLATSEDFVEIPPAIKEKAEIEITDRAYIKAEESMA